MGTQSTWGTTWVGRSSQAMNHGVKICSRSVAWICMVLTRFLLSTSTLTRLVQHGGLRAKRRTGNVAPTAQQHRHLQFTISRHLRLILTALRRLNAEARLMVVCNVLDR